MASRGSVIPLFVDQIKQGRPLTVTDPNMTRFMMAIEDAVDLVLYAYEHAEPGDIFVHRDSAATMGTLAEALKRVFEADNPIKVMGTRHGEKLYETLLTREEMTRAEDCGDYFRIIPDGRDLNYGLYFTEGEKRISQQEDYTSHNTRRLSTEELVRMLLKLEYVREAIREMKRGGRSEGG
jgi:UDP-glucose 4-epimerase